MKRISFQGEHGAYSETSAQRFFQFDIETVPCRTFHDVLEETESGNFTLVIKIIIAKFTTSHLNNN